MGTPFVIPAFPLLTFEHEENISRVPPESATYSFYSFYYFFLGKRKSLIECKQEINKKRAMEYINAIGIVADLKSNDYSSGIDRIHYGITRIANNASSIPIITRDFIN